MFPLEYFRAQLLQTACRSKGHFNGGGGVGILLPYTNPHDCIVVLPSYSMFPSPSKLHCVPFAFLEILCSFPGEIM